MADPDCLPLPAFLLLVLRMDRPDDLVLSEIAVLKRNPFAVLCRCDFEALSTRDPRLDQLTYAAPPTTWSKWGF